MGSSHLAPRGVVVATASVRNFELGRGPSNDRGDQGNTSQHAAAGYAEDSAISENAIQWSEKAVTQGEDPEVKGRQSQRAVLKLENSLKKRTRIAYR